MVPLSFFLAKEKKMAAKAVVTFMVNFKTQQFTSKNASTKLTGLSQQQEQDFAHVNPIVSIEEVTASGLEGTAIACGRLNALQAITNFSAMRDAEQKSLVMRFFDEKNKSKETLKIPCDIKLEQDPASAAATTPASHSNGASKNWKNMNYGVPEMPKASLASVISGGAEGGINKQQKK